MFGYKLPATPDAKMYPVAYRLRKPAKLRIRRPNGLVVLEGFGIGETFSIMEPDIQYLIPAREKLNEIPMPDGSAIIEYPEDIDLERVEWLING